jgi:hypothetical protein
MGVTTENNRPIALEELLVLNCLETNSERDQYLMSMEIEDTPNEPLSEKARYVVNKVKLNSGVSKKWA